MIIMMMRMITKTDDDNADDNHDDDNKDIFACVWCATVQRRRRQTRISFPPSQVEELEKVFLETHYPDVHIRDKLASRLQLTEGRVQVR